MGRIDFRIDDEDKDRWSEFADSQSLTLTMLIRRSVEDAIRGGGYFDRGAIDEEREPISPPSKSSDSKQTVTPVRTDQCECEWPPDTPYPACPHDLRGPQGTVGPTGAVPSCGEEERRRALGFRSKDPDEFLLTILNKHQMRNQSLPPSQLEIEAEEDRPSPFKKER